MNSNADIISGIAVPPWPALDTWRIGDLHRLLVSFVRRSRNLRKRIYIGQFLARPVNRDQVAWLLFSLVRFDRRCRSGILGLRRKKFFFRRRRMRVASTGGNKWEMIRKSLPLAGEGRGLVERFSNPQPNPQIATSCTTCRYFGSPRVLVSCCETNSRYAVTAEFLIGGQAGTAELVKWIAKTGPPGIHLAWLSL